jgi:Tol biopolymer transport system component
MDLARGTRLRVTSDTHDNSSVILSPDGQRVLWASDRAGHYDLFTKSSTGAGDDALLLKSGGDKFPTDWSAHWIVFDDFGTKRGSVAIVPASGGAPRAYLQSEADNGGGRLSPDERWMAYTSSETGQNQVYLCPFPDANAGKWVVSGAGGGTQARWRADGRELYYVTDDNHLMAVDVSPGDRTPQVGAAHALFQLSRIYEYVPSHDGSRFLISDGTGLNVEPLTVVLNWTALFTRPAR